MKRPAWRRFSWVPFVILLGASCASYSDLRFVPLVQDAELREGDEVHARITVAWRGIRERDGTYEARFRMRVENPRDERFELAPSTLELLDGALVPFGVPRFGGMPGVVEPGREATFDVAFPVPPGKEADELDFSALNLRVRFQDERWSWNLTFERVELYYYDPYWDYHSRFHVGVVWCH